MSRANPQQQDPTGEICRYLTRRSDSDPNVFRLAATIPNPNSLEDIVANLSLRMSRMEVAMHQLQRQVQHNTITAEHVWWRQNLTTGGDKSSQQQEDQEQPKQAVKRRKTGQPKSGSGCVHTAASGPQTQFGWISQPYQPQQLQQQQQQMIPANHGMVWVPQQTLTGVMWVPQMPQMMSVVQMGAPTGPPAPLRRSPRTASFKRRNEDDEVANPGSNVGSRVLMPANRRIPRDPDSMEITYV